MINNNTIEKTLDCFVISLIFAQILDMWISLDNALGRNEWMNEGFYLYDSPNIWSMVEIN